MIGPERVAYIDASQLGDEDLPPKQSSWEFEALPDYAGNHPLTWTSDDDVALTQTAWAQAVTITDAALFDDDAFADGADGWTNDRTFVVDEVTGERVFLTAPINLK